MKYQISDWHLEETWIASRASDPETVAALAAEEHLHQTAEYGIVDTGETLLVRVMDAAGNITEWRVRAEASIHFYADAV